MSNIDPEVQHALNVLRRQLLVGEPKVYTFKAIQTGTDAPIVTVFKNTIGTVTWSRSSTGIYFATCPGAFTPGKTFLFPGVQTDGSNFLCGGIEVDEDNYALFSSTIELGSADDLLNNTLLFEIRVYL